MARIKRGVAGRNRRKKLLMYAKGFRGRSKNCYRIAKRRVEKSWQYAYRDRKVKKRDFRALWIVRLNAALRQLDVKYSVFIDKLNKSGLLLNRKVLSNIAAENEELFAQIVTKVMSS